MKLFIIILGENLVNLELDTSYSDFEVVYRLLDNDAVEAISDLDEDEILEEVTYNGSESEWESITLGLPGSC